MRSPVFTHLNATLQGLTTIRAYGAQGILKQEFDKHQDLHTSAWFMYIAASSAFGFYLDVLCFIFTAIVTFSFLTFGEGKCSIIEHYQSRNMPLFFVFCVNILIYIIPLFVTDMGISGGKVGLAITQAAAMTGLVQWGLRQSAEVANQLMSVERVLEYTALPGETQPEVPISPPKEWPQEGKITFRDVGLRYYVSGPLVLKNLNLVVQPKEKVKFNK